MYEVGPAHPTRPRRMVFTRDAELATCNFRRLCFHLGDDAQTHCDDQTTWNKQTLDKLTVTDYYSNTESIYLITPDRLVFRHGFAIDLIGLPNGGVLSKDKETLSDPLNPEEAERVLKVYDLFKKL